jgi:hypothetical protein
MSLIMMAASLVLASVTIVSPLAGALEVPGDARLSRDRHVAVRGVCCPGFTIPGVAEPLAILALTLLLASLVRTTWPFWLVALALVAETIAHALHWVLIASMNGVWPTGESRRASPGPRFDPGPDDRRGLQDRWERSHIDRTLDLTAAFVLLVAATLAPAG